MSTAKSHRQQIREQLAADLAAGRISQERHDAQLARMSHPSGTGHGMGGGARLRQNLRLLLKLLGRGEITLDEALARLDTLLHDTP